ncbi:galactose mutarotase [Flavobacterium sp. CYK-4]|uniref:aldose epimerase family protein n=1 Tax=Flavobacterium lotistagni TaxID=2709660 RepID=UPI001407A7EC|nr:aldose epimerase family protein [Flavobacterium lotistagni]NHM06612.1 galactose mutarotase [Flavobacterium lotistagni]
MEISNNLQIQPLIIQEFFGFMPDGKEVFTYRLGNKNGMELQLTNYGATLMALKVPLKNGKLADVVLGFDSLESYIASFSLPSPPYFGATIGRYAGRISAGRFTLNGTEYQLNQNNNGHALHGGVQGFSQVVWEAEAHQSTEGVSVTFKYTSAHSEEHFPGNLQVQVTYTLTASNEMILKYNAVSDADTIVNLTHHSYFNLEGHQADILNQHLFVDAGFALQTDLENIPNGQFLDLNAYGMSFNPEQKCPSAIDNTFLVRKSSKPVAALSSTKNQLRMQVFTDQPGIHIYVGGNCFNQIKGKQDANYHELSGICFEAQHFPDAPNHEHFPSATLKKGERYTQQTIYKFENLADEKDFF